MKAWEVQDAFGIDNLKQVDRPEPTPGPQQAQPGGVAEEPEQGGSVGHIHKSTFMDVRWQAPACVHTSQIMLFTDLEHPCGGKVEGAIQ